MRTDEYLQAAHAFAEAGVDGDAWGPALGALASLTGSSFAELIGLKGNEVAFMASIAPEDGRREFLEEGVYDARRNPRVAAAALAAPMQVIGDREYDAVAPGLEIERYMDLVGRYDIRHGCQTTLATDGGLVAGLCVLRTTAEGHVNPDTVAAFSRLAPHALAAVRTRRALGERSLRELVGGLEHADVAAFLCDAEGLVHAMTGEAERIVHDHEALVLRRNRLAALSTPDHRSLRNAFASALASRRSSGGTASLVIGPPERRCAVHLRALPGLDWGLPVQPRVLVVVRRRPRAPSSDILRAAFGLTAAEAEIALALSRGERRDVIALHRGATLGTVRQQVKTILAKTGVRREAELILAIQGLS